MLPPNLTCKTNHLKLLYKQNIFETSEKLFSWLIKDLWICLLCIQLIWYVGWYQQMEIAYLFPLKEVSKWKGHSDKFVAKCTTSNLWYCRKGKQIRFSILWRFMQWSHIFSIKKFQSEVNIFVDILFRQYQSMVLSNLCLIFPKNCQQ